MSQSQLRHNFMLRVSTEVIESRILSYMYKLFTLATRQMIIYVIVQRKWHQERSVQNNYFTLLGHNNQLMWNLASHFKYWLANLGVHNSTKVCRSKLLLKKLVSVNGWMITLDWSILCFGWKMVKGRPLFSTMRAVYVRNNKNCLTCACIALV